MDIPSNVQCEINLFLEQLKQSIGNDLLSVVLFGSAVEGRLRQKSDVNLLVVIKKFERVNIDGIRERYRAAHAAIKLEVMYLLEEELSSAGECFAVKFFDILMRHRVLFGKDISTNIHIPREAMLRTLLQVLLNHQLRLREKYVLVSLREEQLPFLVSEAAGPLRSAARMFLSLQAVDVASPKEALEKVVRDLNFSGGEELMKNITKARVEGRLPLGVASKVIFELIELAHQMREVALTLR